ncbi:hypothetical protein TNCV_2591551 [Trichonephila clavipes]|nr:hypothetical protein TNCV_2591551 [Trichonephila clavipes]
MGIPYHPGIKATVDRMEIRVLTRQGLSQTNVAKASRLWQQCSRTNDVFCWWTLCYKEQRSTQVPTEQIYGSSEENCKTNGAVLDHAPYSSDLAPSGFYLFRYLKHSLGGKRFSDNEEMKTAVNSWLSDQVKMTGINMRKLTVSEAFEYMQQLSEKESENDDDEEIVFSEDEYVPSDEENIFSDEYRM